MKVAVSIPDDVFEEADALAARLHTSRSDIYARALAAYVGEHDHDRVTEAMNLVVDAVGESAEEFTRLAARRVLDRSEW
jgi:metal-responsive CopG/Arc/MetJ family transcriptional regulator